MPNQFVLAVLDRKPLFGPSRADWVHFSSLTEMHEKFQDEVSAAMHAREIKFFYVGEVEGTDFRNRRYIGKWDADSHVFQYAQSTGETEFPLAAVAASPINGSPLKAECSYNP